MVGKEVNIEIQNKYTNPEEPGSFASLKTFKENQPYRGRQVSQALQKVETFARHVPVKKKFKKFNTNVCRLDDTWQIDLIDVSKFNNKKYAQSFNFIFICIDVFSKYVWACPMKEKEAIQSKKCIEHIINKSKRKPKAVYHDSGNEFRGEFTKYLQDKGIEQYFSNIRYKYKAGTVERFNRTLKERIWRYFTYSKNTNYIQVLDKLVSSYNNTFHSSLKRRSDKTKKVKLTSKEIINEFKKNKIKFTSKDIIKKLKEKKSKTIKDKVDIKRYTPTQISDNPKLAEEIASEREQNQLLSTFKNPLKFKFKKGNYVRTSVVKTIFEKGYVPNWSEEVYCISTLIASIPPRYKLTTIQKGQKPAELEYLFYEEELQRVPDNEFPYDTFVVREYDKDNYLITKLNDQDQEEESIVSKKDFHKDEVQENPQKGNLTIETIDKVPKKRGRKTRAEKALVKPVLKKHLSKKMNLNQKLHRKASKLVPVVKLKSRKVEKIKPSDLESFTINVSNKGIGTSFDYILDDAIDLVGKKFKIALMSITLPFNKMILTQSHHNAKRNTLPDLFNRQNFVNLEEVKSETVDSFKNESIDEKPISNKYKFNVNLNIDNKTFSNYEMDLNEVDNELIIPENKEVKVKLLDEKTLFDSKCIGENLSSDTKNSCKNYKSTSETIKPNYKINSTEIKITKEKGPEYSNERVITTEFNPVYKNTNKFIGRVKPKIINEFLIDQDNGIDIEHRDIIIDSKHSANINGVKNSEELNEIYNKKINDFSTIDSEYSDAQLTEVIHKGNINVLEADIAKLTQDIADDRERQALDHRNKYTDITWQYKQNLNSIEIENNDIKQLEMKKNRTEVDDEHLTNHKAKLERLINTNKELQQFSFQAIQIMNTENNRIRKLENTLSKKKESLEALNKQYNLANKNYKIKKTKFDEKLEELESLNTQLKNKTADEQKISNKYEKQIIKLNINNVEEIKYNYTEMVLELIFFLINCEFKNYNTKYDLVKAESAFNKMCTEYKTGTELPKYSNTFELFLEINNYLDVYVHTQFDKTKTTNVKNKIKTFVQAIYAKTLAKIREYIPILESYNSLFKKFKNTEVNSIKAFITDNISDLRKIKNVEIIFYREDINKFLNYKPNEIADFTKYLKLIDEIFNSENYVNIKGLIFVKNNDIHEFYKNFSTLYYKNKLKSSFNNIELNNEYNIVKHLYSCIKIQFIHNMYSLDSDHNKFKNYFGGKITEGYHTLSQCDSLAYLSQIKKYNNDSFKNNLRTILKGFSLELSADDQSKIDTTQSLFNQVDNRIVELNKKIYQEFIPNKIEINYANTNIDDIIQKLVFLNQNDQIIIKPQGLKIVKNTDRSINFIFKELNFNDLRLSCECGSNLECTIKDNVLTVYFKKPQVTHLAKRKRKAEIKHYSDKTNKLIKNNKCKVYCDLIGHEVSEKLLKEFTVNSEVTYFENLTYVPIVVNYINSIGITIKDSNEQDYKLQGEIECELHFKKDEE